MTDPGSPLWRHTEASRFIYFARGSGAAQTCNVDTNEREPCRGVNGNETADHPDTPPVPSRG